MEDRIPINIMDKKSYLNKLRNSMRYSEDIIQLIQSDLEYGLTKKEVEEYLKRPYDCKQMKVYSKCLRKGYGKEIIEVIGAENLNGETMELAYDFYEKGVPIDIIKSITRHKGESSQTINCLLQEALENQQETVMNEEEGRYVKELLEQMQSVVAKIESQEQQYQQLVEKFQSIKTEKEDIEVQNNLLKQLEEKEGLLESQQNEINEARTALAKSRNEVDVIKKEKEQITKQLLEAESKEKTVDKSVPKETEEFINPSDNEGKEMEIPKDILMEAGIVYQATIMDKEGRVLQMMPIETVQKKDRTSRFTKLFSRIRYQKKIDIVKLVAERNLSPLQLAQIREAMEQGVKEQQLLVLMNPELTPEQMSRIIQIAVYENSEVG